MIRDAVKGVVAVSASLAAAEAGQRGRDDSMTAAGQEVECREVGAWAQTLAVQEQRPAFTQGEDLHAAVVDMDLLPCGLQRRVVQLVR